MGFVGLLGLRLIRRGAAPAWTRAAARACAGALALTGAAALSGLRAAWVLGPLWLAAFGLGVALLARALRPMLVVSVVGLGLGVASLFVVLGVGSGVEQALVASLTRLNGHATITKYGLDFFEYEAVAQTLEADPRIRAASPYVFGAGALVVLDETGGEGEEGGEGPVVVSIKGMDPRRAAGLSGIEGLFSAGSLASLRPAQPREAPGIVLGARLARRVRAEVGDRVRLVVPEAIGGDVDAAPGPPRHGDFVVLGLLETGFVEFDANFVLVHLSAAQAVVYGEMRASGVEIELAEARSLEGAMSVARALVELLERPRSERGLPPLYRAASWAERSAALNSIRQTKVVLAVILSLIVAVSSGSLIGALLLLVRRKRREIATLAAMGARRSQLFSAFEGIGVLIGGLGSLFGLGLGALGLALIAALDLDLDPGIYMFDRLPVAFDVGDMAIPCALAVLVCALATGPVAWQAAGLRPLDGLRA
ncbi:ABC transporter permease [Pseudenhygromyxa sp. WMMC2535]|uniref:ABC transporter permease n=1 Tax=Pseudenhygromyxa sp. WMMC2535 TaxID=2712867 RepID=UPI0015542693|nr:ABC transporter permease [Pseudenhygromyxa sp. WMMC2535]NVB40841.1 ABC transporter permease [Pseudenhygromyxa sp. WMMC2535]